MKNHGATIAPSAVLAKFSTFLSGFVWFRRSFPEGTVRISTRPSLLSKRYLNLGHVSQEKLKEGCSGPKRLESLHVSLQLENLNLHYIYYTKSTVTAGALRCIQRLRARSKLSCRKGGTHAFQKTERLPVTCVHYLLRFSSENFCDGHACLLACLL